MSKLRILLSLVVVVLLSTPVFAQATRTWVSGVGDDANPCSRTAPCKTFAGAISKTAAQGLINVLDPGGFGTLTITKAITVDGTPFMAGMLAASTNGVIINAGVADRVILRGLHIEGVTTGLRGVRVLQAGTVVIDNCNITGFSQRGISVETSQPVSVSITRTNIYANAGDGIVMIPSLGSPAVKGTVDNCVINSNAIGVSVSNGAQITVQDSTISNNTTGVQSNSTTTFTIVNVVRSSVAHNGTGLRTQGSANAFISMSDVALQENLTAGFVITLGQINSYENNQVNGNGPNTGSLTPVPPV